MGNRRKTGYVVWKTSLIRSPEHFWSTYAKNKLLLPTIAILPKNHSRDSPHYNENCSIRHIPGIQNIRITILEGGVILGIIEEDVELDKSGKEDEEEATDVIVLLELAVVVEEVEVVNFGRPLLAMVITVILAF